MVKSVSQEKMRCPAMIEAEIEDPESHEGIKFCLNCPYPEDCIVFEGSKPIISIRRNARAAEARKMCLLDKLTPREIANRLGLSLKTIYRYLGE